jgi:hypothetical protein
MTNNENEEFQLFPHFPVCWPFFAVFMALSASLQTEVNQNVALAERILLAKFFFCGRGLNLWLGDLAAHILVQCQFSRSIRAALTFSLCWRFSRTIRPDRKQTAPHFPSFRSFHHNCTSAELPL